MYGLLQAKTDCDASHTLFVEPSANANQSSNYKIGFNQRYQYTNLLNVPEPRGIRP